MYAGAPELRRQRRVLELSQEDVAEGIGVSASLLSRWESGDRTPNDQQIRDWVDFLSAAGKAAR